MKRFLLTIIIAALIIISFAAQGFSAGSWTPIKWLDRFNGGVLIAEATFTADASDAGIPTLTFSDVQFARISEYSLCYVGHDPGTTGPTNGAWDITVPGATTGEELSGGAASNLSSTKGSTFWVKDGIGIAGCRPIREKPTVVITGNAVNSASATVYLWFYRP